VSERFMTVAKVGEIPEGGMKLVRVDGETVGVFRVEGGYYALDDVCTHDGGPLAEGPLEGFEIECPRHGARFDLRTGEALTLPATVPVPIREVRVVGDEIQVECEQCVPAAGVAPPRAEEPPRVSRPEAPRPGAPLTGIPERPDLSEPSSPAGVAAAAARPRPAPAPGADAPAPSQQEFAIRAALESVTDPEIELSVIDLGLIRDIVLEPGHTQIRMLLTTPFCPYAPQMMEDVRAAARSVVDQPTDVEILPDAWSPEMMPDPGLLGFSY
jgi:nitrite reductase/ring-hydroxylating ferredoxin subunit/metal-sulfur cluster biosynthetic enzyme